MRRIGYIALALVVLTWAVLAIALGSPSLTLLSGASASAASPACLPDTLQHSAALAGTSVDVSPAPESGTANPDTQISFLGAPAAQIRGVSVSGASSGAHAGRLAPYSQGDGASFAPDHPFKAGERVSVHATLGPGAGHAVSFAFASTPPTRRDPCRRSRTRRPRRPTSRASTRCQARARR